MTDQPKTPWRKIIESDYLAGADLDDGQGNHPPITVTIRSAVKEMVLDPGTKKEESCLIIKFRETQFKNMICNATNAKAISKITGSEYVEDWIGKQIVIGTERVKAFGEIWDALRVKRNAGNAPQPAQAAVACADCGQTIAEAGGIKADTMAAGTMKKYGRSMCLACWRKRDAADKAKLDEIAAEAVAAEGEAGEAG